MDVLSVIEDGDFRVGSIQLSKHFDLDSAVRPELGGEPHGHTSVLSDMVPATKRRSFAKALSLLESSEFESGRVALFTCCCGDLGCGAVTVSITKSGDRVHWSDFGMESNWEKGLFQSDYMQRTGPFTFEYSAYLLELSGYR